MSSSSANATALPSRRSLITQAGMLATIGAAGATLAIPALAMEAGPIERMHAEHVRLSGIYDAALEAMWDAEERYEEPERPRWHPFIAEGGYKMEIVDREKNKSRVYLDDGDENVARLREMIAAPYTGDVTCMVSVNTYERSVERAKETLLRIEAWKAEDKRRADAAGLTQARQAERQAEAAVKEHAKQVFATKPTTFREFAFRAAVLLMTWDQGEADELPEQLVVFAGIEPLHLG